MRSALEMYRFCLIIYEDPVFGFGCLRSGPRAGRLEKLTDVTSATEQTRCIGPKVTGTVAGTNYGGNNNCHPNGLGIAPLVYRSGDIIIRSGNNASGSRTGRLCDNRGKSNKLNREVSKALFILLAGITKHLCQYFCFIILLFDMAS